MTDNPNVIVYRDELLPFSETFILAQGGGLRRYTPYYLGSKAVKGLRINPQQMITVNRSKLKWLGKAQEIVFKIWKVAPGLYTRLSKLQPVLVHAHFGPDSIFALSIAKYLKIPLVVTFHGFDVTT